MVVFRCGLTLTKVVYRNRLYSATIRHNDWERDVCSLDVAGLDVPALAFGDTSKLRVGARVFAIGAPQGLELTLSEGIISSLHPVEGGRYLQISAPISPGSSGGGLFDEEARLIGLPTFYIAGGQQLNFALPVEWISELPQRHRSILNPKASVEWSKEVWAAFLLQDFEKLHEYATRWLKTDPENAWAFNALGVAYRSLNQPEKAIEVYLSALSIHPEKAFLWSGLGTAYSLAGQASKAISAYKKSLAIDPENDSVWFLLGSQYSYAREKEKMIDAYQRGLKINPNDATGWYGLALVHSYHRNHSEALAAYQNSLRIDSEKAHVWRALGEELIEAGQAEMAIEVLQSSLRINPTDADTWGALGRAYGMTGENARAIESFENSLRIRADDPWNWYYLGLAHKERGDSGKVLEIYQQIKTLDQSVADKFFNRFILP